MFDGGKTRIARGREAKSLPVAAKRHSLRFVHLLLFSRTESAAILAADDPQATPARGGEPGGAEDTIDTSTLAEFEVVAKGKTLGSSSVEEEALVGLSDRRPPIVVGGCPIATGASCPGIHLMRVDLSGVYLDKWGNRIQGPPSDLSDANLTGAHLNWVNFTGVNLSGTSFHRAKFCNATMSDGSINNTGC